MSRLFAFADKITGEINTVLDVGLLITQYTDGQETDTHILLDVTDRPNVRTIQDDFLYLNGEWVSKPPRPGLMYDWNHAEGRWSLNQEKFMSQVRGERIKKLYSCDWTQMPDSPLSAEEKEAWAAYRQALRDFPSTITTEDSMEALTWPVAP